MVKMSEVAAIGSVDDARCALWWPLDLHRSAAEGIRNVAREKDTAKTHEFEKHHWFCVWLLLNSKILAQLSSGQRLLCQ
jgi:hypothetical protein